MAVEEYAFREYNLQRIIYRWMLAQGYDECRHEVSSGHAHQKGVRRVDFLYRVDGKTTVLECKKHTKNLKKTFQQVQDYREIFNADEMALVFPERSITPKTIQACRNAGIKLFAVVVNPTEVWTGHVYFISDDQVLPAIL